MPRIIPMRRVYWTLGAGLAGFILGAKAVDTPADNGWAVLGVLWGASIGLGFGTIFDQKFPRKRIIIYWATTLALVGPFFGLLANAAAHPDSSAHQQTIAAGMSAAIGMLVGALIGIA